MTPAELDLFDSVPVTRADVYAWLLALPGLDPQSPRAAEYVRTFDVVGKIMLAKLAGTFDAAVESAASSARCRELVARDVDGAPMLDAWAVVRPVALTAMQLVKPSARPRRTKEQIARDQLQARQRVKARAALRQSALSRLPSSLPAFPALLNALGDPSPEAIGEALQVHVATVRRWIRERKAPHAVILALFWLTKWGASEVDANAHNDAIAAEARANGNQAELEALRERTRRLWQIAEFGSANDPTTDAPVQQRPSRPDAPPAQPEAPAAGYGGSRRPRRAFLWKDAA